MPSQSDREYRGTIIEDIRLMSEQIMYDTLSEGKINNMVSIQILSFTSFADGRLRVFYIQSS